MTTEKLPSGENSLASGDDNQEKQPDVVQYATHRKLLEEKKRTQEENRALKEQLTAFEAEKERAAREELEKQGNYQKLLEAERLEKKRIEDEHKGLLNSIYTAKKMQTVKKFIQGQVYDEVLEKILPLDGVVMNEDGSVDEDTAKLVAQEFEKKYPALVMRDRSNGGLPNEAARGAQGQRLTYAEWVNLPNSAEMKRRQKDVDWSTAK